MGARCGHAAGARAAGVEHLALEDPLETAVDLGRLYLTAAASARLRAEIARADRLLSEARFLEVYEPSSE